MACLKRVSAAERPPKVACGAWPDPCFRATTPCGSAYRSRPRRHQCPPDGSSLNVSLEGADPINQWPPLPDFAHQLFKPGMPQRFLHSAVTRMASVLDSPKGAVTRDQGLCRGAEACWPSQSVIGASQETGVYCSREGFCPVPSLITNRLITVAAAGAIKLTAVTAS